MWAMERWHIPIPYFPNVSYPEAGWPEGHSILPATLYRGHEQENVQNPQPKLLSYAIIMRSLSLLRRQETAFLQELYDQSIAE